MVIFYFLVVLVVWVLATAAFMKKDVEDFGEDFDGLDWMFFIVMGFCIALIWPLTLLGAGVALAARGLVRKMSKEEE